MTELARFVLKYRYYGFVKCLTANFIGLHAARENAIFTERLCVTDELISYALAMGSSTLAASLRKNQTSNNRSKSSSRN
jgi:hypothetical protein